MLEFPTKLKKDDAVEAIKNHPEYACGKKDRTQLRIEDTASVYEKKVHFLTEENKPLAEAEILIDDKKVVCHFLKRRNDFLTGMALVFSITAIFFLVGFALSFIGTNQVWYQRFIFAGVCALVGFALSLYLAIKYVREAKRIGIEALECYLHDFLSVRKDKQIIVDEEAVKKENKGSTNGKPKK